MTRRRYVYRPGPDGVPVATEVTCSEPETRLQLMTDAPHDGAVSADGTDISTRAKRAAYMRAHDVTDSSDFSPEWRERQASERQREAKLKRLGDLVSTYRRLRKE